LQGNDINQVEKLILTGSGGPFRGKSFREIEDVSLEQALNHPNWSMGKKVSIDASTLMNKGFEVIEAKWLFGLEPEKIQVLIHPQSLIHSMVEYADGSIIAQIGAQDMRLPIQYALCYPERPGNQFRRVDFVKEGSFTFEDADFDAFPCLGFAFDALKSGGTMPTVVNGSNEVAVELFLEKKISFNDIPRIIEQSMKNHKTLNYPDINDILEADDWARKTAKEWYDKKS
jgi:1-deoxy-D-xylulose-5-phosphate reductoisomerase